MKIGEFLKTDKGSHWRRSLRGCSKHWECELYSNVEEYLQMLTDNGIEYNEEYERNIIACAAYHPDYYLGYKTEEFVIVIN